MYDVDSVLVDDSDTSEPPSELAFGHFVVEDGDYRVGIVWIALEFTQKLISIGPRLEKLTIERRLTGFVAPSKQSIAPEWQQPIDAV